MQEMVSLDGVSSGQGERLAKLWYIPHITEIVLAMSPPEKQQKNITSIDQLVFRNSQVYLKSSKVYAYIFEIYWLVIIYSKLLQDNKRYAATVKELREADYIVNVMMQIKRDLMAQGPVADYVRVEAFFANRWQYWYLKWKYTISMGMNVLESKIV